MLTCQNLRTAELVNEYSSCTHLWCVTGIAVHRASNSPSNETASNRTEQLSAEMRSYISYLTLHQSNLECDVSIRIVKRRSVVRSIVGSLTKAIVNQVQSKWGVHCGEEPIGHEGQVNRHSQCLRRCSIGDAESCSRNRPGDLTGIRRQLSCWCR